MGLFSKALSYLSKSPTYRCVTLQAIGVIPNESPVILKLDDDKKNIVIWYNKRTQVTLTFERVIGFRLEKDSTVSVNDHKLIAGQILSSGLLGRGVVGTAGKIAGRFIKPEEESFKWVGTLIYREKDGKTKELHFYETWQDSDSQDLYEESTKSDIGEKFENAVNQIAVEYGNTTLEL